MRIVFFQIDDLIILVLFFRCFRKENRKQHTKFTYSFNMEHRGIVYNCQVLECNLRFFILPWTSDAHAIAS